MNHDAHNDSGTFGTLCLTHFCEVHGPSIVFTTQMIPTSSPIYTFPPTFLESLHVLPSILADLEKGNTPVLPNHSRLTPHLTPSPWLRQSLGSQPTLTPLSKKELLSPTLTFAFPPDSLTPPKSEEVHLKTIHSFPVSRTPPGSITINKQRPVTVSLSSSLARESPINDNPIEAIETQTVFVSPTTDSGLLNDRDASRRQLFPEKMTDKEEVQTDHVEASSEMNSPAMYRDGPPSVEILVKPSTVNEQHKPSTSACASCSSLAESSGLLSHSKHDDDSQSRHQWLFISTRFPHSINYAAVRNACVRSLSSEFTPGQEGSVLFSLAPTEGEENLPKDWALSYSFKLADSKARGFQRQYCFLLILKDHARLVSSMSFITKFFSLVVRGMQEKATELMERENQSDYNSNTAYRPPIRTLGIFRREAGGGGSARSLTQILSDPCCFVTMHTRFCWLLRQIERSAVVLPSVSCPKLRCKIDEEITMVLKSSTRFSSTFSTLKSFNGACRRSDVFRDIISALLIGCQIVVRSRLQFLATALINLLRKLLPPPCSKIVPFSDHYHESYECNLLGLSLETPIPSHVTRDSAMMVSIITDPYYSPGSNDDIEIQALGPKATKTTMGGELERVAHLNLSEFLEDMRINSIVQEWTNKANMFYHLSTTLTSEKDPRLKKFETGMGLLSGDTQLLRFWSASMRWQFKERT
ncbi:folliculin-like [Planoprotostelium fungivorum]|uniref:Folliculin n=1 Tax=Planoprotostelium fungivorum TaxID=1890364 RepID=A0A2P6N6M0_9EUKA|nr:folliculin-like [Planoprotostelium fungivorum]